MRRVAAARVRNEVEDLTSFGCGGRTDGADTGRPAGMVVASAGRGQTLTLPTSKAEPRTCHTWGGEGRGRRRLGPQLRPLPTPRALLRAVGWVTSHSAPLARCTLVRLPSSHSQKRDQMAHRAITPVWARGTSQTPGQPAGRVSVPAPISRWQEGCHLGLKTGSMAGTPGPTPPCLLCDFCCSTASTTHNTVC